MKSSQLHFRSFLLLLTAVSIAFIVVLLPYYGSIFWGGILAIIFRPLYRWLLTKLRGKRNLAALITLIFVLLIVILPLILVTGSLLQEAAGLYRRIERGQFDIAFYIEQVFNALPPTIHEVLQRLGVGDMMGIRMRISEGALAGSKFVAGQMVNVGQNTLGLLVGLGVMLYLLFFLLRDGSQLALQCKQRIPMSDAHQQHLFRKFTTVIRATVKGNIVVAITQGALGGIIFWALGIQGALFWGVIMAILSLLPAVGAAIIWVPVAIYFLVTGQAWQGILLIAYGVLVIGLVDNVLRPLLVGKDTKIPDYVILVSTLGGLAVFGINGFVIGPLFAALFIACWDLFPAAVRLNRGPRAQQTPPSTVVEEPPTPIITEFEQHS